MITPAEELVRKLKDSPAVRAFEAEEAAEKLARRKELLRKRAEAIAALPAAEERKLVTILFADLAGSTALGERLDPERLHVVLDSYFRAMALVIEEWGGTVEKYIGDAISVVLADHWYTEDRHDRVADVLLDRSAPFLDHQGHGPEVAIENHMETFGVQSFA